MEVQREHLLRCATHSKVGGQQQKIYCTEPEIITYTVHTILEFTILYCIVEIHYTVHTISYFFSYYCILEGEKTNFSFWDVAFFCLASEGRKSSCVAIFSLPRSDELSSSSESFSCLCVCVSSGVDQGNFQGSRRTDRTGRKERGRVKKTSKYFLPSVLSKEGPNN